ncbi:MAG TPA: hypothetical protein VGD77_09705, partial [Gemmatimonadaceae bacterium]
MSDSRWPEVLKFQPEPMVVTMGAITGVTMLRIGSVVALFGALTMGGRVHPPVVMGGAAPGASAGAGAAPIDVAALLAAAR